MSSVYFLIFVALLAGAVLPVQSGLNNKMASAVDSPTLAALISFLVGTFSLLIFAVASGERLGALTDARNAPMTGWMGGILGAFFVTAMIILLPRVGVALTISLVIAGQMIAAIVIDHFGFFDVPVREVSLLRLAGILLVLGGVVLIRKF